MEDLEDTPMAIGPPSRLTEKERRFAEALVSGLGPTAAYRRVYSSLAGNRAAQANGRKVAKRPRVLDELERLRKYPPADSYSAIQNLAVSKSARAMTRAEPRCFLGHATDLGAADSWGGTHLWIRDRSRRSCWWEMECGF